MLFDSKAPKPKKGLRKYWPLLAIVIIAGGITGYFLLHNLPEEHAVEHFLTELKEGNYKEAYKLWKPAPDYSYSDFLGDWGPQGDYGKIRSFKIDNAESKGSAIVIVTVTINHRTPALALIVDRKSKGLAYSPY